VDVFSSLCAFVRCSRLGCHCFGRPSIGPEGKQTLHRGFIFAQGGDADDFRLLREARETLEIARQRDWHAFDCDQKTPGWGKTHEVLAHAGPPIDLDELIFRQDRVPRTSSTQDEQHSANGASSSSASSRGPVASDSAACDSDGTQSEETLDDIPSGQPSPAPTVEAALIGTVLDGTQCEETLAEIPAGLPSPGVSGRGADKDDDVSGRGADKDDDDKDLDGSQHAVSGRGANKDDDDVTLASPLHLPSRPEPGLDDGSKPAVSGRGADKDDDDVKGEVSEQAGGEMATEAVNQTVIQREGSGEGSDVNNGPQCEDDANQHAKVADAVNTTAEQDSGPKGSDPATEHTAEGAGAVPNPATEATCAAGPTSAVDAQDDDDAPLAPADASGKSKGKAKGKAKTAPKGKAKTAPKGKAPDTDKSGDDSGSEGSGGSTSSSSSSDGDSDGLRLGCSCLPG